MKKVLCRLRCCFFRRLSGHAQKPDLYRAAANKKNDGLAHARVEQVTSCGFCWRGTGETIIPLKRSFLFRSVNFGDLSYSPVEKTFNEFTQS